jgi:hypothetical protein
MTLSGGVRFMLNATLFVILTSKPASINGIASSITDIREGTRFSAKTANKFLKLC